MPDVTCISGETWGFEGLAWYRLGWGCTVFRRTCRAVGNAVIQDFPRGAVTICRQGGGEDEAVVQ